MIAMGKIRFYFLLIFLSAISVFAQKNRNKTSIGTQEVLVVKSYSPDLSDAFKIKTPAELPDTLATIDKELEYKIKSVPVVSTFQPNKATPLKLQQRSSSTPFNTLFSGALGNKNQLYFNISSVIEIDRTQRFGMQLYRDGFGSNLKNTLLKSNQNHSRFGLHHNLRSNEYNANTQIQITSNRNNYFGLYDTSWTNLLINTLDPEIKRSFFKLKSYWNWYDSLLRSISFQANVNSDNYDTYEQQLALQADLEKDLGKGNIKTEVKIQGFKTRFNSSFFENIVEEYIQGLGAIDIFWKNNRNDLKLKIGGGITYLLGVTNISRSLLYYPKLEISYLKSGNIVSPYFMADGGVHQNTYKILTELNPYLAPSTRLTPTFNKLNTIIGVRTSLASVLNFDLGFIFDQVENFSYFERLPYDSQNQNESYRLSNSFQNQYINADIYGFKASIRIDLAKNNFVRFETLYRFFDLDKDQNLWNIPSLEMNWESQFKWNDRLLFSLNGNLLGDRKAGLRPIFLKQDINNSQITSENLPVFITTSAHITYKIADQFDVFIKGRFNTQGIHGRWAFYPEPPFLLLTGVTYKFDFQY
jgi:hypothetical protein